MTLDDDLGVLARDQLLAEVKRLRARLAAVHARLRPLPPVARRPAPTAPRITDEHE